MTDVSGCGGSNKSNNEFSVVEYSFAYKNCSLERNVSCFKMKSCMQIDSLDYGFEEGYN